MEEKREEEGEKEEIMEEKGKEEGRKREPGKRT